MKRFLISFFVILITPKLLIADACFENLKFDWKLLGSGKASYKFSNTSKTNNIKVNTISLKDSSSKIIQVHSPMIIVKKNETKSLIFNLTQPFDKYYKGYSRVICETVYFQGDIEKNISTSDFDMNEYSSVNKNLSEGFKNYSSDNKNLTENIYTHEEAKEKYKPKKFGNRKNNNHVIFGIIFFIIICLLGVVRAGITSSKSSNKKTVKTPSINTKKENIINNKKVEIITKETVKKEINKENKPIKEVQEKKKKKIKVIAEKPFIDLIQSLKYKDKLSLEEFNKKPQSEKKKLYDLYYKIYSFFMDRFRSEAKVETYFKSQNGKTALLGWQVVSKGVFEYSVVETISYFLNLDESITPEIAVICIKKYSEKLNEEKDIESKVKGILGVKSGDLGTSKEKCIFIRYKVETEMNKFIFEKKMNINWKILKLFLDNRSKSPMS